MTFVLYDHGLEGKGILLGGHSCKNHKNGQFYSFLLIIIIFVLFQGIIPLSQYLNRIAIN